MFSVCVLNVISSDQRDSQSCEAEEEQNIPPDVECRNRDSADSCRVTNRNPYEWPGNPPTRRETLASRKGQHMHRDLIVSGYLKRFSLIFDK